MIIIDGSFLLGSAAILQGIAALIKAYRRQDGSDPRLPSDCGTQQLDKSAVRQKCDRQCFRKAVPWEEQK